MSESSRRFRSTERLQAASCAASAIFLTPSSASRVNCATSSIEEVPASFGKGDLPPIRAMQKVIELRTDPRVLHLA